MLFFERILKLKSDAKEQRSARRYAVGAEFPIQAVVNLVGRDEFGEALESPDGRGWDWVGRLVNFSASGVNIQLPKATAARRDDTCTLSLTLADCRLNIPCHVAHVRTLNDSVLFGLKFNFKKSQAPQGYQQLLELVAFGASLKPDKPAAADASGYLVEKYRGDFEAHLTVWRSAADAAVQWFEFQLSDYCVRGSATDHTLEFTAGGKVKDSQPVTAGQVEEIHQLFRWVVPNIARAVPEDVRLSLRQFAA